MYWGKLFVFYWKSDKMLIIWAIASYYYAHEYMYSKIRMMQSIRVSMNKLLPICDVAMANNSRKTILLEFIDNNY